MNRFVFKIIILCTFQVALHAELLIVKKENGIFKPLTQAETVEYEKKINAVLSKYQWPMCTTESLTKQEIAEYLSPDKPYAEEQFVQKKIREVIDPTEIDLHVMFVPTSLYELFCIDQSFETPRVQYQRITPSYEPALYAQDAKTAQSLLHKEFQNFNKIYFKSNETESVVGAINRELATYIFNQYPLLQGQVDILSLSNDFQAQYAQSMQQNLRKKLLIENLTSEMAHALAQEPKTKIIEQVMDLEYEARKLNKALLLRGSNSVEKMAMGYLPYHAEKHAESRYKSFNLIGSTVYGTPTFKNALLGSYTSKYSISFGNSLFAGWFHDATACAYLYMSADVGKLKSYGLLLDKQQYVENNNHDLFFIPPLETIASLYAAGEFFHPRTKVVDIKTKDDVIIRGMAKMISNRVIDPAHILLYPGNTTQHEARFSEFIIKNGRFLPTQNGTDTSQKFIEPLRAHTVQQKTLRILGKKTLQRLARAGSDPIPAISQIQLFDILQNGPTQHEFALLTQALSNMSLEPVTSSVLSMSGENLYAVIIRNRFDNWIKEVLSNTTSLSKALFFIQQFLKDTILQSAHMHSVFMLLHESFKSPDSQLRTDAMVCFQGILDNPKLNSVENMSEILKLTEQLLQMPLTHFPQFNFIERVFTKMVKSKGVTEQQASLMLEQLQKNKNKFESVEQYNSLEKTLSNFIAFKKPKRMSFFQGFNPFKVTVPVLMRHEPLFEQMKVDQDYNFLDIPSDRMLEAQRAQIEKFRNQQQAKLLKMEQMRTDLQESRSQPLHPTYARPIIAPTLSRRAVASAARLMVK
jgi:hypothetical protein